MNMCRKSVKDTPKICLHFLFSITCSSLVQYSIKSVSFVRGVFLVNYYLGLLFIQTYHHEIRGSFDALPTLPHHLFAHSR